jgi:hypothetical protein
MGEEASAALQLGGNRLTRAGFDVSVCKLAAECAPHRFDHGRRRGLIDGNAKCAVECAVADP